jgi:WD40 repeat protein
MGTMLNRVAPVTAIAGADGSRWLASVTYQFNPDFGKGFREVLLWNIPNEAPFQTLDSTFAYWRHSDAICFVPARELAVFATYEGDLGIWDAANKKAMPSLQGHPDGVIKLAASADGRLLASAGADGIVKVWNLDTGAADTEVKVDSPAASLCFSPDGRCIAACSKDGTIAMWSSLHGEPIASFQGDGEITCCAVSSDGKRLVAGESTGRVHILSISGWDR